MAALKFIKSATAEGLTRLINGLIKGKRNLVLGKDQTPTPAAAPHNLYKHPVAGLTLEFTTPAGTVTFSDNLDCNEIIAEINALSGAGAHLYKVDDNGGMVLALWDDTTPVVLKATGTANGYFGFPTSASALLTQTAVAPANIKSIIVDVLSRQFIAFYT